MSCNKEMVAMIGVLNQLQNKMVSLGVNHLVKELPQIVVIGSQSAGKSSVLESFVGRDFLPRGSGIVTRRPLILQLKQNRENDKTFAKFSHTPKVFTDFNDIRLEIEVETERTVPGFGISEKPINLMITAPDVLDLNLIDLPGMTKVAIPGQPANIEQIVRKLIIGFINKPNCLILAVSPANQDLSTSDAIQLAREVDPDGERTIGVLTKLDVMDKGTDARNILLNKHKINLKKGFIGVKNRSTEDIKKKRRLSEAIDEEKEFFAKHSAYKDIKHMLGIEYLQKYLQQELGKHLFAELPTLKEKFVENLVKLDERIESLSFTIKDMNPIDIILNTINNFKKNFSNEIGTGDDVPIDRDNSGTNINVEINIKFAEEIETIVRDPNQLKQEIAQVIKNLFGVKLQLNIPNEAFEIIAQRQIELMRSPSYKCIESVCLELESIVKTSAKGIGKFSKLNDLCIDTTLEYLCDSKKRVKAMINETLETEKYYMSPNHLQMIKDETKRNAPIIQQTSNTRSQKVGLVTYFGVKYYLSIENRVLKWYSDQTMRIMRGSVSLVGAQTIHDKNLMTIKAQNNFEMKLTFYTESEASEWGKAILDNIFDDIPVTNKIECDHGNVKYPININAEVDEIKRQVMAYVKVTEQTLKDRLPKLCQKELVMATELFIGETLSIRFQKKEFSINDLLDMTPMQKELDDLIAQQKLYKEAIHDMNDVIKTNKRLKTEHNI